MASLERMAVDERAFSFADALREALSGGRDFVGNITPVCHAWSTDAFVEHMLQVHAQLIDPRPVLFSAPPVGSPAAGHVSVALREGPIAVLRAAAKRRRASSTPSHAAAGATRGAGTGGGGGDDVAAPLRAHWPQLELDDPPLTPEDYLAFFVAPQRAPPNVIDDRIAKVIDGGAGSDEARAYRTPAAYRILNMLARPGLCGADEIPDSSDLVLSPPNAVTRFHIDSGFLGICDLVAGEKLWAVCSLHDGLRLGLASGRPMPPLAVDAFLAAPSAALVRLREGQILLVPEGFWHFVVTERPSLAFSSNALTVAGLRVSEECVGTRQGRTACQLVDDPDSLAALQATHRRALERHLRSAAGLRAALAAAGASEPLQDQYVAALERERARRG